MANYSLVINSRFSPFSYQEMLAPVMMATQAHQDLENQYGELEAKASMWEKLANEQPDSKAYTMYKTYANDLREQADQLAREGLNTTSRRSALNMRSRYSKEIVPIEQAYDARAKQAYQQQQALLQNPTLMFSRDAATTNLDRYLENPQLGYESYSGALLTEQVGKAASALAKQIQDNPREWRDILGNSYYEALMQRGFNSADVLLAVQNNSKANSELLRIVEDAIDSSNIRSWANKNMLDRAYGYARQGLWNAVGETQYQVLDNWRAKMAAQDYYDKIKFEREHPPVYPEDIPSVLKPYDFFDTDPEYAAQKKAIEGLYTKDGKAIKAKLGERGRANAIGAYEEYNNIIKDANFFKDKTYYLLESFKKQYPEKYKELSRQKDAWGNLKHSALELAIKYEDIIKKKYGIEEFLTDDEYKFLKPTGWGTGKHTGNFNLASDYLKKKAFTYHAKDLNLADYTKETEGALSEAKKWEENNTSEGKIYEVKGNGTQGGKVDIGKFIDSLEDKNGGINKIIYNRLIPDKIMIKTNDGKEYAVDPSILNLYHIIDREEKNTNNILNKYNKAGISLTQEEIEENKAEAIGTGIYNYLQSINPRPTSTSSELNK